MRITIRDTLQENGNKNEGKSRSPSDKLTAVPATRLKLLFFAVLRIPALVFLALGSLSSILFALLFISYTDIGIVPGIVVLTLAALIGAHAYKGIQFAFAVVKKKVYLSPWRMCLAAVSGLIEAVIVGALMLTLLLAGARPLKDSNQTSLAYLRYAVSLYISDHGEPPRNLDALVEKKYIPRVPRLWLGGPFYSPHWTASRSVINGTSVSDTGMWTYQEKSGLVTIDCSHSKWASGVWHTF